MAARLVNDKASALHRGDGRELKDAMRAARAALEPVDSAGPGPGPAP